MLKNEIIGTIEKFTNLLVKDNVRYDEELSIELNINKSKYLEKYFTFSEIEVIEKLYQCQEISSQVFKNPNITDNLKIIFKSSIKPSITDAYDTN
ncbi:hypothetical protein [Myroides fluvii]|uniref:hypothetical protein n=1 Tax=Myroides fluvii TaxID=2572594 RepID=UPI00131D7E4D|nr:hypothetical protein [Myroides fluvii]